MAQIALGLIPGGDEVLDLFRAKRRQGVAGKLRQDRLANIRAHPAGNDNALEAVLF